MNLDRRDFTGLIQAFEFYSDRMNDAMIEWMKVFPHAGVILRFSMMHSLLIPISLDQMLVLNSKQSFHVHPLLYLTCK